MSLGGVEWHRGARVGCALRHLPPTLRRIRATQRQFSGRYAAGGAPGLCHATRPKCAKGCAHELCKDDRGGTRALSSMVPRRPAPPNATSGRRLSRFARPDCATEPVRTVPSTPSSQSHSEYGVPVRRDPLRREAHGTGRPAEPRVAEHPRRRLLDTPQVTPNDTKRHQTTLPDLRRHVGGLRLRPNATAQQLG